MSVASVMPSSHLILWCPLLHLLSIFPSIRDFSNESAVRIRWPKYWSFSFSISPSNEYSELISLKIYWFYLLTVQGALRCLLQHHSSKASILCTPPSLWSTSHNHTWPLGRPKHMVCQYKMVQNGCSLEANTIASVLGVLPEMMPSVCVCVCLYVCVCMHVCVSMCLS